jgi:hypothetical protein
MSSEPGLFESIRQKRLKKRSGTTFYSLSILFRAVLITILCIWLIWTIYPRIFSGATPFSRGATPASAPVSDTVTFSEPDELEKSR